MRRRVVLALTALCLAPAAAHAATNVSKPYSLSDNKWLSAAGTCIHRTVSGTFDYTKTLTGSGGHYILFSNMRFIDARMTVTAYTSSSCSGTRKTMYSGTLTQAIYGSGSGSCTVAVTVSFPWSIGVSPVCSSSNTKQTYTFSTQANTSQYSEVAAGSNADWANGVVVNPGSICFTIATSLVFEYTPGNGASTSFPNHSICAT